jgi:transcriptional regulator with GAF, ATPase, and Fis domain
MDAELLSETFVELTDTMVAGFDVIDFMHVLTDRSVQLLDVSAAGLLLADPRGELRVVGASSETARLLELFQLQNDEGPCLDCFRTGRPVQAADLAAAAPRWPRFAPAARQAGFAAVQALPMRLREQVIGALNLFRADPGALAPAGIRVGQALADLLRDHARASNRRLSDLARAFIDGTESLTGPDPGRTRPPRPATRPSP